jgi:hypothetical protein
MIRHSAGDRPALIRAIPPGGAQNDEREDSTTSEPFASTSSTPAADRQSHPPWWNQGNEMPAARTIATDLQSVHARSNPAGDHGQRKRNDRLRQTPRVQLFLMGALPSARHPVEAHETTLVDLRGPNPCNCQSHQRIKPMPIRRVSTGL